MPRRSEIAAALSPGGDEGSDPGCRAEPGGRGRGGDDGRPLPRSLFRYILQTSGAHQLVLSLITVCAFLIELAPLELQRRIVNDVVKDRQYQAVLLLCAIYAGAVLLQGATKLAVNMYRSWIGECAIRKLRRRIRALGATSSLAGTAPEASGVEVSMIVAEVEPVGGFVGEIISEPLAHGGTLLSTFAYLLHLDAWMTLAASAIFVPQFVFVPLLQRAINRRTARRVQLLREVSASVVGTEDREAEVADETRIARVFHLNMGIYWLKYSMNFLMNFGNHLQVVIGLLLGGWLVLQGHLAVGSVVAFISGIAKIKDPWDELVDYFRNMAVTLLKFRMIADASNAIAHDELPVQPDGKLNPGRENREGRAAAPDR